MIHSENNNFENEFCFGIYQVSVDSGHRIRLKTGIVQLLHNHKVEELWQYPDPTGPRVILCPPQFRAMYAEWAKQHVPKSIDSEIAQRMFIFSGQPVYIDDEGRVLILDSCRMQLKVKRTDVVYIIGTGMWYEVWQEKDWLDKSENTGLK